MTPLATPAFLNGFAMSLVLIVAIGAQNAFVLRQGLRREHLGVVVLWCMTSDALLIAVGVAGMAEALRGRPLLAVALSASGAIFLAVYGLRALRRARHPDALVASAGGPRLSARSAVLQAAAFTLLNPHVYLDTVLLVGGAGAQYPAALRGWFVVGAALASAAWFGALGYGARLLAPLFARPRAWQALELLIGATMLLLAALLAQRALAAGWPR